MSDQNPGYVYMWLKLHELLDNPAGDVVDGNYKVMTWAQVMVAYRLHNGYIRPVLRAMTNPQLVWWKDLLHWYTLICQRWIPSPVRPDIYLDEIAPQVADEMERRLREIEGHNLTPIPV